MKMDKYVVMYMRNGWKSAEKIIEVEIQSDLTTGYYDQLKALVRENDPTESLRKGGFSPDIVGAFCLLKQNDKWSYLSFNRGWE